MYRDIKLLPETIEMFIRLENLYSQRELIMGYHDRSLNHHNIRRLESDLDFHCDKYYELPWFRLYAHWRCGAPLVEFSKDS